MVDGLVPSLELPCAPGGREGRRAIPFRLLADGREHDTVHRVVRDVGAAVLRHVARPVGARHGRRHATREEPREDDDGVRQGRPLPAVVVGVGGVDTGRSSSSSLRAAWLERRIHPIV